MLLDGENLHLLRISCMSRAAACMKTCIATVSVPGNFREKIEAISVAGFDAIELFEPDLIAYGGAPREAAALIRDHGLQIAILQPLRNFEGQPDQLRHAAFEEAKRKFDVMTELGAKLLLACSAVSGDTLDSQLRMIEDFAELGDLAAKSEISVGYEALAWGQRVRDVGQAWDVVRQCNHPNIGIVLDSFHTLIRRNDPELIRTIPGRKIFFVQIADAPRIEMDVLQLSRHYRTLPGKGDLDVSSVVRAIMSTGYAGPLSLEIFRSAFPSGGSNRIAKESYDSLVRLITCCQQAPRDNS